NQDYVTSHGLRAKGRTLQPQSGIYDSEVVGTGRFEAVRLYPDGKAVRAYPVVASFNARPSRLNLRMFNSIGELNYLNFIGFFALLVLLIPIGIEALITGIMLPRRITSAVDGLYYATQFVQKGDFSHRVKIESRDQLGVLGESFNLMTGSINNFI